MYNQGVVGVYGNYPVVVVIMENKREATAT